MHRILQLKNAIGINHSAWIKYTPHELKCRLECHHMLAGLNLIWIGLPKAIRVLVEVMVPCGIVEVFVLKVFLIRLDICNSLRAELIAYFYGLRMAWNKGYQKLHVEVNSYTFIQLMTKVRKVENLRFHNIISQYRNFLSRFWQVRVTHCHRESNMVANKLVNITVACLRRLEFISFNPNAVVDLVD